MKKTYQLTLLSLVTLSLGLASCNGAVPIEGKRNEAASSTPKSTATETEPSDLNIYLAYDGERADRSYVWGWSDDPSLPGSLFPVSSADNVTFEKTGDDIPFIPVYLTFNQEYECFDTWTDDVTGTPSSSFTLTEDNVFTGLVFRDASGDKKDKKGDLVIDPSKLQVDENGHRSIWIDDSKGVYYSINDFPVTPVESAIYKEVNNSDGTTSYTIELNAKTKKNLLETLPDASAIKSKRLTLRIFRNNGAERKYKRSIYFKNDECVFTSDKITLVLNIDKPLDLSYKYVISLCYNPLDLMSDLSEVDFKPYYSSRNFDMKYYTMEKLGATIQNGNTIFKVWSPSATDIKLNLYKDATTKQLTQYTMKKDEKGVFSVGLVGNLHGYYYTFDVNNYGDVTKDVADPYAYSSNANGKRSMVVDFDKIHEGDEEFASETTNKWAPSTDNYAGVTIMEMHTRDFSSSTSWNGTAANRGKFNALHESGTSLSDGTKTGFDYVKELKDNGLTHVQIMPAFDFSSVDETKLDDSDYINKTSAGIYNWGYDPQQYNAPEGSYSSDPSNGLTRVNEFSSFVEDYNKAGLGVVMDVVYNHMPSSNGTSFEDVFPGYYFRSKNSSGAGADIASQRGMVRRFIVDSVVSWAKNYHISGFRFDLMGLLDMNTMVEIRKALDKVDPNILVYGEGWSMFSGDPDYGYRHYDMGTQGNINAEGDNWVGAFNDDYRDALPGKNDDTSVRGYIQQALGYADGEAISQTKLEKIYYGLTGTYWTGSTGRPTYSSKSADGIGASIAYVECHDNLTLYDHFELSRTSSMTENDIHKEVIMANDNLLGSLSSAFFQIGQDFGKSKKITDKDLLVSNTYYKDPFTKGVYYSHNSYNSSDKLNQIDWNLLKNNKDISTAFRKALKNRSTNALELGSSYSCLDFYNTETGGNFKAKLIDNDRVISYSLDIHDGEEVKTYYFAQNFTNEAISFTQAGTTIPAYGTVSLVK